ncbi:MAG: DEAD/DEAH box helicase [bacterium]
MNKLINEKPESFTDLGVAASILAVLDKNGITMPTPIQHKAIPIALEGNDLIGIAQTGTGKTFAFGLPMIERINLTKGKGLILLPTRELALQVESELDKIGQTLGLRLAVLIGGEGANKQVAALRRNPHIVVATPGRLIDFMKRGLIRLNQVKILVLDEADMMLDMGFLPQVEQILKDVPLDRQTMLFSATMPVAIAKLASKYMKLPVSIEVAPAGTTAERVEQELFVVRRDDKFKQLVTILDKYDGSVLVFTRTKYAAKSLTRQLKGQHFAAAEIHSDRSLQQRKEALQGFKDGKFRVLIATDIAARGIDVKGIELVVNYDLPDSPEDYVHRIGRTGRAGQTGRAISFAISTQWKEIKNIERLIKMELPKTKFAELEEAPSKPVGGGRKPPRNRFSSHGVAAKFRPLSKPVSNIRPASGPAIKSHTGEYISGQAPKYRSYAEKLKAESKGR